jgi:hypothetical protein
VYHHAEKNWTTERGICVPTHEHFIGWGSVGHSKLIVPQSGYNVCSLNDTLDERGFSMNRPFDWLFG